MNLFKEFVEKHGIEISGVINVGTYKGAEMEDYLGMGIPNIVVIEPQPIPFKHLEETYRDKAKFFNLAIADYEGQQFLNISSTDNDQYNSFLKSDRLNFNGTESVNVCRLDRLGLDVGAYNLLSLDINGWELFALKSSIEFLQFLHYIIIKRNKDFYYLGSPSLAELKEYLHQYHFDLVEEMNDMLLFKKAGVNGVAKKVPYTEEHLEQELLNRIPNLMPHQLEPFNGDHYVASEFLALKNKFNINTVIELGTCLGGSTVFFGRHFDRVITTEIQPEWQNIAMDRAAANGVLSKITGLQGDSERLLPKILAEADHFKNNLLIFIDDHWGDSFPLEAELRIIKESGLQPIMVIHDFKVPGEPKLGYDSYHGKDICVELVKPYLDEIYGADGYEYYFNSDAKSTEVKRGVMYITPKNIVTEQLIPGIADAATEKLKIDLGELQPPSFRSTQKVNLFINYYEDENPERQKELMECFTRNLENKQIDHIFVIVDKTYQLINYLSFSKQFSHKVTPYVMEKRPSYADYFKLINEVTGEDDINILGNMDIYYDDLSIAKKELTPGTCYALSRWDVGLTGEKTHFNRQDSQDVWIFNGKVKPVNRCDFTLGRPGCDNAIADRLATAGYRVINPSHTIKCYHLHLSNVRNYDKSLTCPTPYKLVPPIAL